MGHKHVAVTEQSKISIETKLTKKENRYINAKDVH